MRKVKIKRKKVSELKIPKLKPILITPINKPKIKLKPIKKIGYWCDYYPGRLPFPIECSYNKQTPISVIFIEGKKKISRSTPKCPKCKRAVEWSDWKEGKWNKVKKEIEKGADLRNEPSPIIKD